MKVLFCGGPVHGQWREVSVNSDATVEVVAPPTPKDFANGTGTLTRVRYRLWRITLLGYKMVVAAPEKDHNESDSVLYAVLQRDVADHLRGRG